MMAVFVDSHEVEIAYPTPDIIPHEAGELTVKKLSHTEAIKYIKGTDDPRDPSKLTFIVGYSEGSESVAQTFGAELQSSFYEPTVKYVNAPAQNAVTLLKDFLHSSHHYQEPQA